MKNIKMLVSVNNTKNGQFTFDSKRDEWRILDEGEVLEDGIDFLFEEVEDSELLIEGEHYIYTDEDGIDEDR